MGTGRLRDRAFNVSRCGVRLCRAVGARDEPRLSVQAPRCRRGARRGHAPPTAQRDRSVPLEVVDDRLAGGGRCLSCACRRAHAAAALARPGGAVGRVRPSRRARGAILRVPARPPAVGRDRLGGGFASAPGANRTELRRRPLRLLRERHDHLRGRCRRGGDAADLLGSHGAGQGSVRSAARRGCGARFRDLRRGNQGAERRSREWHRRACQSLDGARGDGGGGLLLRIRPQFADRRRRGRDRGHLRRRELVHDPGGRRRLR